MERLKTAEALYECIPITIYIPFAFLGLRMCGRANTGPKIMKFILGASLVAPCVEMCAMKAKD